MYIKPSSMPHMLTSYSVCSTGMSSKGGTSFNGGVMWSVYTVMAPVYLYNLKRMCA